MASEIASQPGRFSAGALLRTLVQDAILPNAATVGGFGELRYWARTPELRAELGLGPPVFVPRVHVTLTTPIVRRALERAGVDAARLLTEPAKQPAKRTSSSSTGPAAAIRALSEQLGRSLAQLRPEIAKADRGLSARSKRTASDVAGHLERLAARVERATRNQGGKHDRHLRHAQSMLRPRGQPQERVLTTFQTTVELGGPDWIDQLHDWIDPFPTEHLLLDLDGDTDAPATDG